MIKKHRYEKNKFKEKKAKRKKAKKDLEKPHKRPKSIASVLIRLNNIEDMLGITRTIK